MRRYVKPMTELPKAEPAKFEAGSFDVAEMLEKSGEILRREISNLMIESSGKKLSPTSARDLTSYIKLLHELKTEQQKQLSELTDEELANLQTSAVEPSPQKPGLGKLKPE